MEKKQGEIIKPINTDMTKEEILGMPHFASDFGNATMVVKWRTALEAMQEYATQEKQGWVKTSERLPEWMQDVIVFIEDIGVRIAWVYNDGSETCFRGQYFNKTVEDVTHWMPLPQKPEV